MRSSFFITYLRRKRALPALSGMESEVNRKAVADAKRLSEKQKVLEGELDVTFCK